MGMFLLIIGLPQRFDVHTHLGASHAEEGGGGSQKALGSFNTGACICSHTEEGAKQLQGGVSSFTLS